MRGQIKILDLIYLTLNKLFSMAIPTKIRMEPTLLLKILKNSRQLLLLSMKTTIELFTNMPSTSDTSDHLKVMKIQAISFVISTHLLINLLHSI